MNYTKRKIVRKKFDYKFFFDKTQLNSRSKSRLPEPPSHGNQIIKAKQIYDLYLVYNQVIFIQIFVGLFFLFVNLISIIDFVIYFIFSLFLFFNLYMIFQNLNLWFYLDTAFGI